jgi:hypothetical protein
MEKTVQIIMMRHGDKDGDQLTPLGVRQIMEAALALKERGIQIDRFAWSGVHRAQQSFLIAMGILADRNINETPFEPESAFDYADTFQKCLDGDKGVFRAELVRIKKAGGSVAAACEVSEFARTSRWETTEAILSLAENMAINNDRCSLVLSHIPRCEMAVPHPENMEYCGLAPADAVIYVVDTEAREILSAEVIRAPEVLR